MPEEWTKRRYQDSLLRQHQHQSMPRLSWPSHHRPCSSAELPTTRLQSCTIWSYHPKNVLLLCNTCEPLRITSTTQLLENQGPRWTCPLLLSLHWCIRSWITCQRFQRDADQNFPLLVFQLFLRNVRLTTSRPTTWSASSMGPHARDQQCLARLTIIGISSFSLQLPSFLLVLSLRYVACYAYAYTLSAFTPLLCIYRSPSRHQSLRCRHP